MDADPAAAKLLLDKAQRDVRDALDEAARLALRIHPPQLEAGGLAIALRTAASNAGVRVGLDVATRARYPPAIAAAVYWCCLEALEHADAGAHGSVTVRDEEGVVTFEIVVDRFRTGAALDRLRDRVEALGGWLTIRSESDRGTHLFGSIPLPE